MQRSGFRHVESRTLIWGVRRGRGFGKGYWSPCGPPGRGTGPLYSGQLFRCTCAIHCCHWPCVFFFLFFVVLTVFLGYKGCWEARIPPPMCPTLPELCNADIPGCTTMQKRILDNCSEVLQNMSQHIQVMLSCDFLLFRKTALGRCHSPQICGVTLTLKPYMAVTAHWLENILSPGGEKRLDLKASLIGFLHFPGELTLGRGWLRPFSILSKGGGLNQRHVYFSWLNLANYFFKIGWVTTDNAGNNGTMMVELEKLVMSQQPNTGFSAESCHIRWISTIWLLFG